MNGLYLVTSGLVLQKLHRYFDRTVPNGVVDDMNGLLL